MGLNLSTKIGSLRLKNPVLVASGTFGHAKEFEKFYSLEKLGGIITKTITVKPRLGNPPPRIVETPSGMLNAIGLQNPGVDKFIEEKLPYLRRLKIPVICSVMGYSIEEFTAVLRTLEKAGGIDGYELNLSCPNVGYQTSGSMMFAHDEGMIEDVVAAARRMTKKVLIAKLGPDVSDIGRMASAAERAGADAVSLINTFMAMVIDVKTRRPVLANRTGGLSGPCVRPIAVRMTWEASQKVKIPVIGIGAIMNPHAPLEVLTPGPSPIQVGTANFMNPFASLEVLEGLEDYLKKNKIPAVKNLIGSIQL